MKSRRTLVALTWCGALLVCCGCGSRGPAMYPVEGTVTFTDGTPVRMGLVEILPTAGGPSARGSIDKDGHFVLGTLTATDGARAGDYVAVVAQPSLPISTKTANIDDPAHAAHANLPSRVSLRYADPTTSGLQVTVRPNEENRLNLVVKPANLPKPSP